MTRETVRETQRRLRGEIAARLGQGDSLDTVERELIAPSRLSEEQQSLLWLYGWSLPQLERRRASPYLESLDDEVHQPRPLRAANPRTTNGGYPRCHT